MWPWCHCLADPKDDLVVPCTCENACVSPKTPFTWKNTLFLSVALSTGDNVHGPWQCLLISQIFKFSIWHSSHLPLGKAWQPRSPLTTANWESSIVELKASAEGNKMTVLSHRYWNRAQSNIRIENILCFKTICAWVSETYAPGLLTLTSDCHIPTCQRAILFQAMNNPIITYFCKNLLCHFP